MFVEAQLVKGRAAKRGGSEEGDGQGRTRCLLRHNWSRGGRQREGERGRGWTGKDYMFIKTQLVKGRVAKRGGSEVGDGRGRIRCLLRHNWSRGGRQREGGARKGKDGEGLDVHLANGTDFS